MPVPVVIGVNWYSTFSDPVVGSDGRWWIGRGDLGYIRGGHAVCLKPQSLVDSAAWWQWMDQGREGACVGFAASRAMMLLNRKRYDARWLWNRAKEIDEWPETNPGDDNGTSVRAAMDVLRMAGHVAVRNGKPRPLAPEDGIAENRWAQSVDEVLACLGSPRYETIGAVPVLNSWGIQYPHTVWIPLDTLDRLIREDGEATMFTDRA